MTTKSFVQATPVKLSTRAQQPVAMAQIGKIFFGAAISSGRVVVPTANTRSWIVMRYIIGVCLPDSKLARVVIDTIKP